MKTQVMKWSVFALVAMAAAFVGTDQANAKSPSFELSIGRRLVRPAVVTTPVVHPGFVSPGFVSPGFVSPGFVSPGIVTPGVVHPAVMPGGVFIGTTRTVSVRRLGLADYPYMVGFPTVRRRVVVGSTIVSPVVVGGGYYTSPGISLRISR